MRTALIITETTQYSHLTALELDERIQNMGHDSYMLDFTDQSYQNEHLNTYDAFILMATHIGPLYNLRAHDLLTTHKNIYRGKPTATVMLSTDPILAEYADKCLKNNLKSLGATLFTSKLLVDQTAKNFDVTLNLIEPLLDREIDIFLTEFLPRRPAFSPKEPAASA